MRCRNCHVEAPVLFDLETHRPAALNAAPSRPFQSVMQLCSVCMAAWLAGDPLREEAA